MGRVVFITVICAFVAAPVLADLTVQYSGASPAMSMYVESSSSISEKWLVTGQYKIDIQGTDTGDITGAPGIVNAFCIDLWDWAPTSPLISYTLKPLDMTPDTGAGPMGPIRAEYLATLLNTYWDRDNWSSDASRTFGSTVYSADQVAAAAQLAVWEIVDEFNTDITGPDGDTVITDDWDVKSGLFRVSDGDMVVLDIANAMLSSVVAIGPSSFGNYQGLSNSSDDSHYQDYVVMTPIPPSVVLGLLGLGVVGLKLRKFA